MPGHRPLLPFIHPETVVRPYYSHWRRAYKAAWSNDDAFTYLMQVAGGKLDREYVPSLLDKRAEMELI